MPKLNTKLANKVQNAEPVHDAGFELLPAGPYLARLRSVEARQSTNGHPQWSVRWEEIHNFDHERFPGMQFMDLNLPQDKMPASYDKGQDKWDKYQRMCEGRLAAFFEALGYTADSDTDEMLGEWAVIVVSQSTIQRGPKQGEKRNEVRDVQAIPDDLEIPEVDDDYDSEETF